MIQSLVQTSAGPAIGIFIGVLIGLFIRKRRGVESGLLSGSPFLTASAAGGVALLVFMAINYVMGA